MIDFLPKFLEDLQNSSINLLKIEIGSKLDLKKKVIYL